MARLLDLPEEILNHTLDLVYSQHGSSSSLVATSRSCHILFKLSESYIYRNLRLNFGNEASGKSHALSLFTAISNRPQLTSYVRLLEAHNWHKEILTTKIHRPIAKTVFGYLNDIVSECRLEPRNEWTDAIKHRTLDAWMALLISQLHGLEALDLAFYPSHPSSFVSKVLAHSFTIRSFGESLSTFDRLRAVRFSPERKQDIAKRKDALDSTTHQDYEIAREHILPLLSLPALDVLHLVCLGRPGKDASISPISNCVSPLSSLSIIEGRITETTLSSLLHAVPSLSTLQYHANIEADSHHYISGPRLLHGLRYISSTLRTLQLSVGFWSRRAIDESEGWSWGLQDALGSSVFRNNFPVLENIQVPIALLLGWTVNGSAEIADVLPPSVRTLLVSDCLSWFERYEWEADRFAAKVDRLVRTVGRSRRGHTADVNSMQLRCVVLRPGVVHPYGKPYRTTWVPLITSLQKRGHNAGIKVGVVWQEDRLTSFIDMNELPNVIWELPENKPPPSNPPKISFVKWS